MMPTVRTHAGWICGLCALAGCVTAYPVAPPPNAPESRHAEALALTQFANPSAPVMLYVTDRNRLEGDVFYGGERSNAMAFGQVQIGLSGLGRDAYSAYMLGRPAKGQAPVYGAARVEEHVRFPGTPLPFSLDRGVVERDRTAIDAYQQAADAFRNELAVQLQASGTGKVVLYVHGFNNSFRTGALNLLELWAASGWTGVPIMFSWPTEQASPLTYFADTQDGAFSVYHLKETLRLVASTPGLDSVTVVAHSHGASIASNALRELLIESRGAAISMYDTYRIETLIMAAPDIDLGVMEQRLVAERFGVGFGQINVYLNPDDNALGIAELVFGNRRFGATTSTELSPEARAVFKGVKTVHFIMVEGARGDERHNYFRLHPGVLADIGMTIRTDARPADPERPLEHLDLNFWKLDRDYRPVLRDAPSKAVPLASPARDPAPVGSGTASGTP